MVTEVGPREGRRFGSAKPDGRLLKLELFSDPN